MASVSVRDYRSMSVPLGWQHVGITNTLHIEQDLNMSWSHGTFSGSAVTCGAELDGKQVGLEYLWNL